LKVPRKVIWNKTPKGQRNRRLRAKKKTHWCAPGYDPGTPGMIQGYSPWRVGGEQTLLSVEKCDF